MTFACFSDLDCPAAKHQNLLDIFIFSQVSKPPVNPATFQEMVFSRMVKKSSTKAAHFLYILEH
jgi:hypothetical protein